MKAGRTAGAEAAQEKKRAVLVMLAAKLSTVAVVVEAEVVLRQPMHPRPDLLVETPEPI